MEDKVYFCRSAFIVAQIVLCIFSLLLTQLTCGKNRKDVSPRHNSLRTPSVNSSTPNAQNTPQQKSQLHTAQSKSLSAPSKAGDKVDKPINEAIDNNNANGSNHQEAQQQPRDHATDKKKSRFAFFHFLFRRDNDRKRRKERKQNAELEKQKQNQVQQQPGAADENLLTCDAGTATKRTFDTTQNQTQAITAIGQTAPTQQDMSAFSSTKTFKSAKSSHKSMRSTPEKAKSDVGKSTPEMILVK